MDSPSGGAGELSWDREDTSETGKSASNSKLHCTYNVSLWARILLGVAGAWKAPAK